MISETYTWLGYRKGAASAQSFLDDVELAVESGRLHLKYANRARDRIARVKLRRYHNQDLSYVDALSLAIRDELPNGFAVFAFDRHFALTDHAILPGILP